MSWAFCITEKSRFSVAIEEVRPEDWAEEVYKPDIERNPDKIYKKPGYDPSDL